jgi:hypothetical protein
LIISLETNGSVWEMIRPTLATVSLRGVQSDCLKGREHNDLPYAHELDIDTLAKCRLEFAGEITVVLVDAIRERDLFVVSFGEEANTVKHASQSTSGIGTS